MSTFTSQKNSSFDGLPFIDISGIESDKYSERMKVGKALNSACLRHGFFYVINHGVSESLQNAVFDKTRAFFSGSLEEKLEVDKSKSSANRGYEPLRGQALEAGGPADVKEGFYIGQDLSPIDPRVLAGRFNHGSNQWPQGVEGFRETMEAYYECMLTLNKRIMHGLALALGLPEEYFSEFCRDPLATLRLLHYPPQKPTQEMGEKGAGAHTDFGGITLLLQDENPGLQVWDFYRDKWINADPVPGTYVANLGDLIARWTNDRYRSTLHRVINVSGRERYSVPFFFSGNPDCEISCLPNCLGEGEQSRYPTTTVESHLKQMYQRTYA